MRMSGKSYGGLLYFGVFFNFFFLFYNTSVASCNYFYEFCHSRATIIQGDQQNDEKLY